MPRPEKENKMATFFGIPYPIVGFICFILAAVFMYGLWPRPEAGEPPRPLMKTMLLHYFHPLAWVLFGMAAFMQARFIDMAIILAGIGIFAFVMFLLTWLRN
jgi:hypothetical protein